jgi:hypothetical protein
MANYSRGTSTNIIVGAAALFVADTTLDATSLTAFEASKSFKDTLTNDVDYTNVGYTTNGLELMFQPTFGEVSVDQILDVAKLYKQGMKVDLKTSFAEATLENLLLALAYKDSKISGTKSSSSGRALDLSAGDIGECPVERGIVAIGPGTGDCINSTTVERVYTAYRALSIDNVSVMAKRDAASEFAVNFRLLPEDVSGSYGKIVDRTHTLSS